MQQILTLRGDILLLSLKVQESMIILFTLSRKSIHLAGKVYKFLLDLAGKVYTFPSDKKRITFLCGKLGKVDKFLVFHIRILYTIRKCLNIINYGRS